MIGAIRRGFRHGQLYGVCPLWSGPSLPATWRPCVLALWLALSKIAVPVAPGHADSDHASLVAQGRGTRSWSWANTTAATRSRSAELGEHPADMRLDRGLADAELRRDLRVRPAPAEDGQHLPLAIGQPAVLPRQPARAVTRRVARRASGPARPAPARTGRPPPPGSPPRGRRPGCPWRAARPHRPAAPRGPPERPGPQALAGPHALARPLAVARSGPRPAPRVGPRREEWSRGRQRKGGRGVGAKGGVEVGGEGEQPHRQPGRRHRPGQPDAVQPRQPEVEHDDVGQQPPGQLDRLHAVAGLADHGQVVLGSQHRAEAGPQQRLPVGQQQPNRRSTISGPTHDGRLTRPTHDGPAHSSATSSASAGTSGGGTGSGNGGGVPP